MRNGLSLVGQDDLLNLGVLQGGASQKPQTWMKMI